jgi:hypothetical protein
MNQEGFVILSFPSQLPRIAGDIMSKSYAKLEKSEAASLLKTKSRQSRLP